MFQQILKSIVDIKLSKQQSTLILNLVVVIPSVGGLQEKRELSYDPLLAKQLTMH